VLSDTIFIQLATPPTIDSLLPSMLVSSLITGVSAQGLTVKFLGFFDGTIDAIHLDKSPESFKSGKKVSVVTKEKQTNYYLPFCLGHCSDHLGDSSSAQWAKDFRAQPASFHIEPIAHDRVKLTTKVYCWPSC
jgi:hypothetical protein